MANKSQFINRVTDLVMELAQMSEKASGMSGVYVARGYFPNGSDPITDADLAMSESKLTAEQFNTLVVPLIGDFIAFGENVALNAKDRKADMNIARKDI